MTTSSNMQDVVALYKRWDSQLADYDHHGLHASLVDAFQEIFKTTGWFSDVVAEPEILRLLKCALKTFSRTGDLNKFDGELQCQTCSLRLRPTDAKAALARHRDDAAPFGLLDILIAAVRDRGSRDDEEAICKRCRRK